MSSSYDEMNRVLITDDVDQQCIDLLIENGFQVEKDLQLAKKPDELIQKLQVKKIFFLVSSLISSHLVWIGKDVDILIVRSATKVTRKIIEECPRLKLIGRAGTGTDNIDTNASTEHGILVMKFVFVFVFVSNRMNCSVHPVEIRYQQLNTPVR